MPGNVFQRRIFYGLNEFYAGGVLGHELEEDGTVALGRAKIFGDFGHDDF